MYAIRPPLETSNTLLNIRHLMAVNGPRLLQTHFTWTAVDARAIRPMVTGAGGRGIWQFQTGLRIPMKKFLLCALLLAPIPAFAEAPATSSDDVQHDVSITFSPIHLTIPVFEVTGEYRLADKMGVAFIGGGGTVDGVTLIEAGAQFRYYVLGSFVHGAQLGAEVLYLHADGSDATVEVTGQGFGLGPFAGYKIATNLGFTFDAQVGAQYILATADASSGSAQASAEDSDIIVLLNLNVGWSF